MDVSGTSNGSHSFTIPTYSVYDHSISLIDMFIEPGIILVALSGIITCSGKADEIAGDRSTGQCENRLNPWNRSWDRIRRGKRRCIRGQGPLLLHMIL